MLQRLFRKGSVGRSRVMHPVCIVARYVGEILQQAIETDVLVVIAANGGRCVRSAKFCVFVVQHGRATRADSHAPLTNRADDRKIPVIQMKGHTVFPAIVEDSHLLFSILTEDGIAASAGPVPGVKCLGQRLERADCLRGKAADEKTRLRVDDPAMTSFAVIKHEPHLPFRYGSIIAGAAYNNTDSAVLSGICYAGNAEKPPVPAVFQGYGRSVIIGFQKTQIYQQFAGSRQEVFILKIQNDENNAAQQDNGRRIHINC